MTSQIERWQETDVWNELEGCKHVLKEPRAGTELEEIMRDFRNVIRDTEDGPSSRGITGALLLAVFRGKVAEGIDFSDNEARCVLTVSTISLFSEPYSREKGGCAKNIFFRLNEKCAGTVRLVFVQMYFKLSNKIVICY